MNFAADKNKIIGGVIQGADQLVTLFASVPLTDERWEPLAEGELIAVAGGQLVARQSARKSPIFYDRAIDQSALKPN